MSCLNFVYVLRDIFSMFFSKHFFLLSTHSLFYQFLEKIASIFKIHVIFRKINNDKIFTLNIIIGKFRFTKTIFDQIFLYC